MNVMEYSMNVWSKHPMLCSLWTIFSLCTAKIGYAIHGSIFWSIMDYLFTTFAWIKWFIFSEVNISIIKKAFEFFFV